MAQRAVGHGRPRRLPRLPRLPRLVLPLVCLVWIASATTFSTAASAQAGSSRAGDLYHAAATFTGPVTVGHVIEPLGVHPLDLASHGYVQQEFFASGTSHAFRATSTPFDGKWTVAPTTSAGYRTRILVRRPTDPSRFSGTVVVEWMNVTSGESAPDWDYLNPALMDSGDAYVGVSVQALGVEGGTPLLGSPSSTAPGGLVHEEPARYGSLHQPGDQYALDIFDQVGAGLRARGSRALGPLTPRHVVAVGESQSAFYLTTFADTLQPLSRSFDGIFIHSRAGNPAPINGASLSSERRAVRIRTDLSVPVFMFETQTDMVQLGYAAAQQPDTPRIRTWEVAGTSHADSFVIGSTSAGILGCTGEVNTGPQHLVVQAAFEDFVRWVVHGTPPPSPPAFRIRSTSPMALALDPHGNAIGGVRTPAVDVPISTLSGAAAPGTGVLCSLFGSTVPFSPQALASLYGTPEGYMARYTAALDRSIARGYVLPADRAALIDQARRVSF
jgi:hypothetical protein